MQASEYLQFGCTRRDDNSDLSRWESHLTREHVNRQWFKEIWRSKSGDTEDQRLTEAEDVNGSTDCLGMQYHK